MNSRPVVPHAVILPSHITLYHTKFKLFGSHEDIVVEDASFRDAEIPIPPTLLKDVWERLKRESNDFYIYYEPTFEVQVSLNYSDRGELLIGMSGFRRERTSFIVRAKLAARFWRFDVTEQDERRLIESLKYISYIGIKIAAHLMQDERSRVLMLPLCSDLLRLVAGFLFTR